MAETFRFIFELMIDCNEQMVKNNRCAIFFFDNDDDDDDHSKCPMCIRTMIRYE